MINKANLIRKEGRTAEALRIYHQVDARFNDSLDPAIRAQVAAALLGKGLTLESSQPWEALNVYNELVTRFRDAAEPRIRRLGAIALINAAELLGKEKQQTQALSMIDQATEYISTSPRQRWSRLASLYARFVHAVLLGWQDDVAGGRSELANLADEYRNDPDEIAKTIMAKVSEYLTAPPSDWGFIPFELPP